MELVARKQRSGPENVACNFAAGATQTEIRTRRLVYSAAAVYAVVFAGAAALVYSEFLLQRHDLGDYTQGLWSTAHGDFLRVTTDAGREMLLLGAHVEPLLALLVPLWWLWPSPLMLLVVQAIAVASGALPVYWLARKHLGSGQAAAHIAFAYLLFPATQFNAFTISAGPHPVSLAIPLILFGIWFLDNDRLLAFAVVACLAAASKEEIPVAIGCLGVWYAVTKGRRLVGLSIFAAGLAVTLVDFLVVIPDYSPTGANPFVGRYADVGGTPGGMLHTLVTNPLEFAGAAATWHKAAFLMLLLVPFLGLWLLEPLLLLGAVPDLVLDLLSSRPAQTTLEYQYTAGVVPFLIAATIFGTARARRNPRRLSFLVLAATALLMAYSPVLYTLRDVAFAADSGASASVKSHALELVPRDAAVSASNQFGGYVSARRFVVIFPYVDRANWVILDRNDPTYEDVRGYRRAVAAINADPMWRVVYAADGVEVLRRREAGRP